jgi:subtilisin family serine protease
MDSNDERAGVRPTSRAIAQLDVVRRSKISPALRAAVKDWEQRRLDALRAGAEADALRDPPVALVLIELNNANTNELEAAGIEFKHLFGLFYAATISLDRLVELSGFESVKHIHRDRETEPTLDDSILEIHANTVRNPGYPFAVAGADKFTGAGIIVGIIDSGINYFHPVFRLPNDQSKSRILAILDQTVTPNKIYTKADIETAIASNTQLILPGRMVGTNRVETENSDHQHGTHVAGIAAGNGSIADCHDKYTYVGVAPEADLVIVKYSFGGSVALQAAIEFISTFASTVGPNGVPCVINMSLGNAIGRHDGTDTMDQMIETFLSGWAAGGGKPVVLVASAGNSGGHADGHGLVKGDDSHVTGLISPSPPTTLITFKLPDLSLYSVDAPKGTSTTTVQFRYMAPVGFSCRLIPPGNNITGSNSAGPDLDNLGFTEKDRGSTCSIDATVENAAAGIRRLEFTITSLPGKFNKFGDWVVELTSGNAGPVAYHGWISGQQYERFTGPGPDLSRANTITSPGSAPSIICVGSYASSGKEKGEVADSSSRGPLLGLGPPPPRQKPDISAPGVNICSAKRDFNDTCCCDCCCSSYIDMSGTSMAAPHVTGAVALMLQRNPTLSYNQIKTVLMATAVQDSLTTAALPNNTFGQGKLDVRACLNWPTVRGTGTEIAASSPTRARVTTVESIEAAAKRVPHLPQIQEGTPLWRLIRTAEGQELYLRGRKHWEEVRALVNGNKRIATVWHRNHGPLLMHHVTRATMLPHVVFPMEIDGELISIRAARLVSALERHASKDLINALHQTLPLIAQLQGKTLLEVVEMFEAREANKNARVLQHA